MLAIPIFWFSACAPSSPISTFEMVRVSQAAEDAESDARTTKHYLEKLKQTNVQLGELVKTLKKEAADAEKRAALCEGKLRVLGVEISSQPSPKLPDINK